MCFHYRITKSGQELEKVVGIKRKPGIHETPVTYVNGFNHPITWLVRNDDPQHLQTAQWGLLPHWTIETDMAKHTLNARIETLDYKPSFSEIITQRCLIYADGFYEWQWLNSQGTHKQKYLITTQDRELFTFAGLYSDWVHPIKGTIVPTFTIITTQANDLMRDIHNTKHRMPVILQPNDEKQWLNGENHLAFAFPYTCPLQATPIYEEGDTLSLF
ncbi:MAG: SOS response-associated peptidase [Flavobacterium sp.]